VHADYFRTTVDRLTWKRRLLRFLGQLFRPSDFVANDLLFDLRPAHCAVPQIFPRFRQTLRRPVGAAAPFVRLLLRGFNHVMDSPLSSLVSPADRFFHT
jgi:hypothetical protein